MAIEYTALEKGFIEQISPGATTITDNTTQVFSFIWVFGVIACVAAGAAILATSGVRLTAADSGSKAAEIKKDIKRAIYGVLGVLLLWLILNQVNPDLLRGNIGLTPIQPTTGTGVTPINPTTPTTPNTQAEKAIRDRLALVGISVNKAACPTETATNCTRLEGLPEQTITLLERLGRDCITCNIVITGGTEAGHSSHGKGKFPVDLRIAAENDALYNYVSTKGSLITSATFCSKTYWLYNWRFCDEKGGDRHWHVYMQ